jgi:hypothetical protein
MKEHKKLYSLLALGALLLLMSACAPVVSSGGSSLSPGQVLQNSAKAMTQLKSAHFDLKVASNLLANNTSVPTTPTPVPNQVNVNITGSGGENLPDQQSLQINIGQNITLNEDLSSLNNSATPGATPTVTLSGLLANFDSITNLSNFNQPVTITPPANAIPTDNLMGIFG